ncbi:MAG: putative ABC transporter permease [Bacilli bacterium]|nr:putative ABC transporter permease [Bacilli bacterium]
MSSKKFAEGINAKKLFWIFLFGCVFGTIWEMSYHFIQHGEIVSRSALIYGPFNPVYGLGALVFASIVNIKNPIKLFLTGMGLGGFCEYVCSLVQEKVFGTVAWDYSDQFLNFNGRTSIAIMFFWGILAIVFVKIIYPYLSKMVESIPLEFGNILTVSLALFMAFNCVISVSACLRQKEREKGIKATNEISVFLDRHYPDERLNKIYVNSYKKEK